MLEGIDGSGTTTQLKLLEKSLLNRSIRHFTTSEPTQGAIGSLIRSMLAGRTQACPETLAYLFAADRYEHIYEPQEGIIARHSRRELIISDRYLFSSLAYQSIECGEKLVLRLNEGFPLPSLLIFIDIPIEICLKRLEERSGKEIFEHKHFLEKVIDSYSRILALFSETKMQAHVIDGTLSKEEVFRKIWDIISLMPILRK